MTAPARALRDAALLSCTLAFAATAAQAGTFGSLRGRVVDHRGDLVAGVTVAVSSRAAGLDGRGAVTDAAGAFYLPSLPPAGDYELQAAFPGFATMTLSEIVVAPGQSTAITVALQPEERLRERIEVRARPQIVNLEETTTQTRIGSEFLDALPILGRNYQDILVLAPGVTDVDGDGNPNIHGARDTDMVTLLDGVSTTDPYSGRIGAQLNIESIQEIEVKTSGATAEFGRAQGGFANVITKSGGNEFEGSFKFHWRGSALDGDGAGTDDPRLHGGLGEHGLRDLRFDDYLPFVSIAGPIVRDRAWFYATGELVVREEPINAVRAAFIAGVREFRQFAKVTWQAGPATRLTLSVNHDPQTYLNEGLNSFTREEAGYEDQFGGTVVTARSTAVLSPLVALETAASVYDSHPERVGNLDPDTNANGFLWEDSDGDGLIELTERDRGEDLDGDGVFDVFEPPTQLCPTCPVRVRDLDGDHVRTRPGFCEGALREDINCDGTLDVDEDLNGNGQRDPDEPDVDKDNRFDRVNEDRNGNGLLDDTPFPAGLYPYGRLAPVPPDRDYVIDRSSGIRSGPHWEEFSDTRSRLTLRQDLSVHVPDFRGSHDLKAGLVIENERFDRDVTRRAVLAPYVPPYLFPPLAAGGIYSLEYPAAIRTFALNPVQRTGRNEAAGLSGGIYVQDHYKPRPNLSLGFGVRFDRERIDSAGYTFFDPEAARQRFDRLNALIGSEIGSNELVFGDGNGVTSVGILGDPIFSGLADPKQATAPITDPIRRSLPSLFVAHHTQLRYGTEALQVVLPEVFRNGQVDPALLAEFGVQVQEPAPFVLTNNNLAPRLSVSWDPWSDGRTKLFATWGRYYDKLFLSSVVGEQGPDVLTRYYSTDNGSLAGIVLPALTRMLSQAPPSFVQVDRSLGTPFSDETTVGIERELSPEVSLSLTWVRRRFRDQLQDVDINHRIKTDADGVPLDVLGRTIQVDKVTDVRVRDGRPDLFINNVFFNQILRIGNTNQARYDGMTLHLLRRLSRRWEMNASYTYARARGDAEDFQSRQGNDPSTVESEFGYLDFDQRHVLKMSLSTFLPRDWQLAGTVSWGSGLPYSVISRFFALDNADYAQFRTRYGYTERVPGVGLRFVPVQRNGERNPAIYDINLRAKKSFVAGRTSAALFLEVFNLLNTDDIRIYTYEPTPDSLVEDATQETGGTALQSDPNRLPQGIQAVDAVRRFGRRFQIGFQFDF